MKKKSSENDQSTGYFYSFLFFYLSPDPKPEKNPVNQLIKNVSLMHVIVVFCYYNF